MRICWDNIEGFYLTKNGNLRKSTTVYIEKDMCQKCGLPYLTPKHNQSVFCSVSCQRSEARKGNRNPMFGKKRPKHSKRMRGENNPFYGKVHSNETLKKQSYVKKGKNNPMFGRCGKESPNYGKKHSKNQRKKQSERSIGKNNPNWKGGISCEPYCDAWADKEYKESIKQRDGYRCMNPDCWKTSKRLSIHHIDYNKKNCKLNNLITLCNSCNSRANKDREWHQNFYSEIMKAKVGLRKDKVKYLEKI